MSLPICRSRRLWNLPPGVDSKMLGFSLTPLALGRAPWSSPYSCSLSGYPACPLQSHSVREVPVLCLLGSAQSCPVTRSPTELHSQRGSGERPHEASPATLRAQEI